MAAIARTARAVRNMHMMRVAGFRTTSQAGLDRTSSPVPNLVPASEADLGFSSPTWYRDTSSAYSRGFATKEGDMSEEKRVESKVRDELGEPEGGSGGQGAKDAARHAVNKVGEKVKDAGKTIKSSTSMDTVGNSVEDAGDTLKDKGAQKKTLGKEDVVTS